MHRQAAGHTPLLCKFTIFAPPPPHPRPTPPTHPPLPPQAHATIDFYIDLDAPLAAARDSLVEAAVAAAASADAVVVIVGTDGDWESEGADRVSMDLPGRQDELVEAVLAALKKHYQVDARS